MTGRRSYGIPVAFRRALTDKLKEVAKTRRWTLSQLQRQMAYDRLLERLYLVGSDLRMTGEPEVVPPLARVLMPDVEQHGYRPTRSQITSPANSRPSSSGTAPRRLQERRLGGADGRWRPWLQRQLFARVHGERVGEWREVVGVQSELVGKIVEREAAVGRQQRDRST